MTKEKFGTDTAIYNKLFYNSRGQLSEIRESTSYTGPTDTTWNRGAIINHYSNNCWGMCGGSNSTTSMSDNNGNLKKQEVYIPLNDQLQNAPYTTWWQGYDYDNLNRLQRVHEYTGNPAVDWQQEYVYDRYGNRTIHQTNTWGAGVNKKDFTANAANNNRLGVPGGQSGTMTYDAAGNLTTDTYSGAAVTRAYDAENRMTSETQANNFVAGVYTYNADGQRVRRTVGGQPSAVSTWQVYGFAGELLAEYAASATATLPQKEYGYRNGQLLITAEPPARSNLAQGTNGGVATASSSFSLSFTPNAANNGDRKGLHWGSGPTTGNGWQDGTGNTYPDWLQIDFNGSKSIDEIDVFTIQDNWTDPVEPSESMTFTTQGLTSFDVQYWNGTTWVTVPNGSISGNNKVWRKLTFAAITTSKIRVVVNGALANYSRLVELEAWGTATGSGSTANINWLVTDQLGTPRMIFDKTGAFATVKRHDYLPFGEELFATQGARTASLGYGAADGVRQKFTQKERDNETGLDFFNARYYSSTQGRFTSADPILIIKQKLWDPQQWNMYAYTRNSPLRYVDPSGKYICRDNGKCESDEDKAFEAARQRDLNSKDKKVRAAAAAYGDPNVDNKVTLGFWDKDHNATEFGVGNDGKYNGTVVVTISKGLLFPGINDPKTDKYKNVGMDAQIAHEGEHVRIDKNIIDHGYDPKYGMTHREAEHLAYDISERVFETETTAIDGPPGKAQPLWQSPQGIDQYLDSNPLYEKKVLDSPLIDTSKVPQRKTP